MLFGRFLQGIGAAGPRIVAVALIRDLYEGRMMARVMSFIMSIFILVPAIAPALGEVLLQFWGWHAIFLLFISVGLLTLIWFMVRQPETLPPEKRIPFSPARIYDGTVRILRNPTAFGYTVTMGFVFSGFIGYLSSAQQIFQSTYDTGELFALYFGTFALSIGFSSYVNARLVMRFGMRPISIISLLALTVFSVAFFPFAYFFNGIPPFWSFLTYGVLSFFCLGMLFGNLNAMAMEPLGEIAGIGAAVVGSLSTLIAVPFGILIGQLYDGGILALIGGFALLGASALAVMHQTGKKPMEHVVLEREKRVGEDILPTRRVG